MITKEKLGEILNNVENQKVYYAGGSLCVDNIIEDDVLIVNLDGIVTFFGIGWSRTMCEENHKLAFEIYKKFKGETEYYKKHLKKFEEKKS
jgi:hypothetical protein